MLLTVSEINEPINFYDLYDLEANLFTTEILIEVEIMMNGVKARVIRPIFQQYIIDMSNEVVIVVAFRQMVATMPVTILWI